MGLLSHGTFSCGKESNVCHSAEACDRDKGHLGLDEPETGGLVQGLQRGKGPHLGSAGWSEPVKEGEGSREGMVHCVKCSKERKMGENGEAAAMWKGDLRGARLQRACENSGLQEERDGAPTVRIWGSGVAQDEKKGEM